MHALSSMRFSPATTPDSSAWVMDSHELDYHFGYYIRLCRAAKRENCQRRADVNSCFFQCWPLSMICGSVDWRPFPGVNWLAAPLAKGPAIISISCEPQWDQHGAQCAKETAAWLYHATGKSKAWIYGCAGQPDHSATQALHGPNHPMLPSLGSKLWDKCATSNCTCTWTRTAAWHKVTCKFYALATRRLAPAYDYQMFSCNDSISEGWLLRR